ncbi:MAG: S41 family peptidase [Gammaproteobacteria bacterium]
MQTARRFFPYPILFFALALPAALPAQEKADDNPPSAVDGQALPLDELRTFTEVFTKIKNDYVESIDDRELIENAIRGMLEGLDPHSAYLDEAAYEELQEGTSGEFGGLGIEVGMEDGFIKVIAPIDDTPAQRAGIRSGDLIIRLNDTPVKGMSLSEAVQEMRGKPGTTITLTILREGVEKPLTIAITRDIIKVQSVRKRTLEPGVGYLRVSHFQMHTAEDLQTALTELIEDNGGALKGLILDLRNNPGGILSAAISVSDLFLNEGLIVYTEGRVKDAKLRFSAKPVDVLENAPMIVLVNSGSASASEIVAGALQDHRRAIIMGEKTFGKGSVQTILPMNNDAALKLTTARYYTPSGRSIQAEGITPDIQLSRVSVQTVEETNASIKEANLSGHLTNSDTEKQEAQDNETEDDQKSENNISPLVKTDYALYEALNVLKGLIISRSDHGEDMDQ